MPQQLRPSPAVRASLSEDGLVLLDIDGGFVLTSNQVGARIWQLVDERRTLPDIARQVSADYGVPLDRAQQDVENFVAALLARGLVTEERQP
jgi:coenzyme PQQ synthesis protein D (PqqD)